MSKGPEPKDSAEAGRKRRGGLRVPSDNVPRRAGSDSEVSAPVPEAVGLAASVSEAFGVAGDEAPAPGNGKTAEAGAIVNKMEKLVSETTKPDNPQMSSEEEVTQVVEETSPDMPKPPPPVRKRSKTAPVPPIMPVPQKPTAPAVAANPDPTAPPKNKRSDTSPGFVPPGGNAIVRPPTADIVPEKSAVPDDVDADEETSESFDIPFDDDDDDATINTPMPANVVAAETMSSAGAPATPDAPAAPVAPAAPTAPAAAKAPTPPSSKEAASPNEAGDKKKPARETEKPSAPKVEASNSDRADTEDSPEDDKSKESKKKPRFTRALTMALNESDLEEVRSQVAGKAQPASPVKPASPAESADVIADDDIEEISANSAPASAEAPPSNAPPLKKKRAETAEPPPPPPQAQKSSPPKPAPTKPAAKKSSLEEGKRRKKPWFEELFDEDYLRTLPFLTPQATQFEANFVMESLGVDAGAQILDVGCGYGRHAMELAARGYHLVGLDSSLPLLLRGADEAQRRGLTINFVHGDMREMTYESQFDGAYCLFSSFGYFDDETNKRTAQNIAKALKPGARFVVEVLNRDYLVADLPSRVWWEGDGCVVLEEVEFNYFSSRIVSNRSVVFDDGRQVEHEISLRSFSLHELGKFLHAVGFRVLEISGSMSTRGRFFGAHSRDIVVVAERRATKPDEA
jgi:SAM-dependent methyltransferase